MKDSKFDSVSAKKVVKKRSPKSFDFGDDQVALDWLSHQHNKTNSLKILIHLGVKNYGNGDLLEALIDKSQFDEGDPGA